MGVIVQCRCGNYVTIASEQDLVRDHDLLKRSHTNGILDPESRAASENSAALFVAAGDWPGSRDSVRDTTMNMVLRPNEALVWRWGHLTPLKYHGPTDIKVFGPRSDAGIHARHGGRPRAEEPAAKAPGHECRIASDHVPVGPRKTGRARTRMREIRGTQGGSQARSRSPRSPLCSAQLAQQNIRPFASTP